MQGSCSSATASVPGCDRPAAAAGRAGRPAWHLLLDLAELPVAWTLIGGQMVLLHVLEHGQVPPQVSQDGDIIADVRADQNALKAIVAALEERVTWRRSRPTDVPTGTSARRPPGRW